MFEIVWFSYRAGQLPRDYFESWDKRMREIAKEERRIQEDEVVFGLLHAGNRAPAEFKDPERFDITRAGNHYLGFGYGPHFCVGAAIARMETEIAITTLLHRLPGLDLRARPSSGSLASRSAACVRCP